MRILHLLHRLPDAPPGGCELHAVRLARAQHGMGHPCRLVVGGGGPSERTPPDSWEDLGVDWIALPPGSSAPAGVPAVDRALVETARQWRADVIHVHHLMNLSSTAPRALRDAGFVVVTTLHDFWMVCPRGQMVRPDGGRCVEPQARACSDCLGLGRSRRWFRRPGRAVTYADLEGVRDLAAFDLLVAPSPTIAERWIALGADPRSVTVVAHGLPPANVSTPPERCGGTFVVGVLGSVLPTKGQEVAAQAMAHLPADVELQIRGPLAPFHGDRAHLDRLAALAERDPRIRLMGPFEPADLGEILAGLDAVAVPSTWEEHFGLVLHEARQAGLPVIGSRIGAIEDAIEDGVDGLLVDPGDSRALARAILRLRDGGHAGAIRPARSVEDHAREISAHVGRVLEGARSKMARSLSLASVLSLGMTLGALAAPPTGNVETRIDLERRLSAARVRPDDAQVRAARLFVGGDEARSIFQHPDSEVRFRGIPVHEEARLLTSVGIADGAWDQAGNGVLFEVAIRRWFRETVIFRRSIDPRSAGGDRAWIPIDLPLAAPSGPVSVGSKIDLVFRTLDQGDGRYDWSGWREPVVVSNGTRPSLPDPSQGPSLLLITIDTLRADHVGAFGGPFGLTPTLDSLASIGAIYRGLRTHAPITAPAHASLFTGELPRATGVRNNGDVLLEGHRTLAEEMRENGARTGAVVALGVLNGRFGFDRGFEMYDDVPEGPVYWRDGPEVVARAQDILESFGGDRFFLWVHLSDPHEPYEPSKGTGNRIDLVDSAGREFPGYRFTRAGLSSVPLVIEPGETELELRAQSPGPSIEGRELTFKVPVMRVEGVEPELLSEIRIEFDQGWAEFPAGSGLVGRWMGRRARIRLVNEGPTPQRATLRFYAKEHLSMDELAHRYQGEVADADQAVGELLAMLRGLGHGENTVVSVLSDHGEALGDRGFVGHVHHLYDDLLSVPWIVAGPGVPVGWQSNASLGLVNVGSTLRDLVGFESSNSMAPGRESVTTEHVAETSRPQAHHDRASILSQGWKFIRTSDPPLRELYEMAQDPGENLNRIHERASLAARLENRLVTLLGDEPIPTGSVVPGLTREQLDALGYVQ